MIAAQSIGEPGTQLTMRTFHIGGAASRARWPRSVEAKSDGSSASTRRCAVTNGKGELVVMNRVGEMIIVDQHGRERERYQVPYGATLGQGRPAGQGRHRAGELGSLTRPIITEFAGKAKFENVEEGVTVAKQVDEVTGLSTLVVIDPARPARPRSCARRSSCWTHNGNEVKIPGTDQLGDDRLPGRRADPGPRRPRTCPGEGAGAHPGRGQKTRDITGGLPRVAELFEARTPERTGTLAEVTGTVSFGKETKGQEPPADHRPRKARSRGADPGEEHPGARRPGGQPGESDRRRPGRSAGHPAPARHRGTGALHRRRGAGRLPPAGREDQRQAHRGDRSPDAAPRADRQPGRHRLHRRRAGRALELLDTNDRMLPKAGPATHADVLLGITKASLSTDSSSRRPRSRRRRAC